MWRGFGHQRFLHRPERELPCSANALPGLLPNNSMEPTRPAGSAPSRTFA